MAGNYLIVSFSPKLCQCLRCTVSPLTLWGKKKPNHKTSNTFACKKKNLLIVIFHQNVNNYVWRDKAAFDLYFPTPTSCCSNCICQLPFQWHIFSSRADACLLPTRQQAEETLLQKPDLILQVQRTAFTSNANTWFTLYISFGRGLQASSRQVSLISTPQTIFHTKNYI